VDTNKVLVRAKVMGMAALFFILGFYLDVIKEAENYYNSYSNELKWMDRSLVFKQD
jgi:hypothetical protein